MPIPDASQINDLISALKWFIGALVGALGVMMTGLGLLWMWGNGKETKLNKLLEDQANLLRGDVREKVEQITAITRTIDKLQASVDEMVRQREGMTTLLQAIVSRLERLETSISSRRRGTGQ